MSANVRPVSRRLSVQLELAIAGRVRKESFAFGAVVGDENVVDLGSLQALTHPLRLRLLSRLRTDGPATAAELGRALGQSRGAMSYHLRQLERFGFVVDDVEVGDRRKRRWRATAQRSVLARGLLRVEPEASDAVMAIVEAQIAPVLDALAWSMRPDASERWAEAFMSFDHELRLDAGQLLEMRHELEAVVDRFFRVSVRRSSPEARMVAVYLGAAPEKIA